jgi:hypothetical protein
VTRGGFQLTNLVRSFERVVPIYNLHTAEQWIEEGLPQVVEG